MAATAAGMPDMVVLSPIRISLGCSTRNDASPLRRQIESGTTALAPNPPENDQAWQLRTVQ